MSATTMYNRQATIEDILSRLRAIKAVMPLDEVPFTLNLDGWKAGAWLYGLKRRGLLSRTREELDLIAAEGLDVSHLDGVMPGDPGVAEYGADVEGKLAQIWEAFGRVDLRRDERIGEPKLSHPAGTVGPQTRLHERSPMRQHLYPLPLLTRRATA